MMVEVGKDWVWILYMYEPSPGAQNVGILHPEIPAFGNARHHCLLSCYYIGGTTNES